MMFFILMMIRKWSKSKQIEPNSFYSCIIIGNVFSQTGECGNIFSESCYLIIQREKKNEEEEEKTSVDSGRIS